MKKTITQLRHISAKLVSKHKASPKKVSTIIENLHAAEARSKEILRKNLSHEERVQERGRRESAQYFARELEKALSKEMQTIKHEALHAKTKQKTPPNQSNTNRIRLEKIEKALNDPTTPLQQKARLNEIKQRISTEKNTRETIKPVKQDEKRATPRPSRFSAEHRRKLSESQEKRWAFEREQAQQNKKPRQEPEVSVINGPYAADFELSKNRVEKGVKGYSSPLDPLVRRKPRSWTDANKKPTLENVNAALETPHGDFYFQVKANREAQRVILQNYPRLSIRARKRLREVAPFMGGAMGENLRILVKNEKIGVSR